MDKCVVIVPSMTPMGPIKGAVALANGLSDLGVAVTFVALKKGSGANTLLSSRINLCELGYNSNFSLFQMVKSINKLVFELQEGEVGSIPIISMCFSADVVNLLIKGNIRRVSSVRGDLKMNYSLDHKYVGRILAVLHYFLLRFFDLTFAMNLEMQKVLQKGKCRNVVMVPNFLNERDFKAFSKNRDFANAKRIVFVGSLSERKKPMLLLNTVAALNKKGYDLDLTIVGDGPLRSELVDAALQIGNDKIKVVGFQNYPLKYVSNAHVMVLPSLSEGTPRAVMEALFIGIPCVMRNLSTNDSLVMDGVNGYLFDQDNELEAVIIKSLRLANKLIKNDCILDNAFSQMRCCKTYLMEVEKL